MAEDDRFQAVMTAPQEKLVSTTQLFSESAWAGSCFKAPLRRLGLRDTILTREEAFEEKGHNVGRN